MGWWGHTNNKHKYIMLEGENYDGGTSSIIRDMERQGVWLILIWSGKPSHNRRQYG